MSIITISRQYGSHGKEIAEKVASELGYKFLDKESLESLTGKYGIPDVSFEKYDERSPGFFEYFKSGKDRYLRYLKTAVFENSKEGNCVICGRGAQLMLRDMPGVLHIRFISSMESRIKRVSESLQCDNKSSEKIIIQNDKNRSGFHKFFFEHNWKDPYLYDLIINTDKIDIEDSVDIIKKLNNCKCTDVNPEELKQKLQDKFIAQEVIIALLYQHSIPIDILDVTCDNGHVSIKGTVTVEQNIEQSKKAALTVEGVKSVDPEIYFITNYMGY
ncbi:MAG: cytidylate kinase family protein [Spirochaetaceae bacterium]|jgi:cytidylate kinase|nr:cytidylate kinase family protein [Spirochaetaceae bacterium]